MLPNGSLESASSSVYGQSAAWLYGQSAALVVALLVLGTWVYVERRERLRLQKRNEKLADASIQLVEQHSKERVAAEERHLLTHDSTVRNILDSLERAASNTPRP